MYEIGTQINVLDRNLKLLTFVEIMEISTLIDMITLTERIKEGVIKETAICKNLGDTENFPDVIRINTDRIRFDADSNAYYIVLSRVR